MWNLLNCYLSGRHEYGMCCEPGAIFLRCLHCGKRSPGWTVAPKPLPMSMPIAPARAVIAAPRRKIKRVLPFGRAAAQ